MAESNPELSSTNRSDMNDFENVGMKVSYRISICSRGKQLV